MRSVNSFYYSHFTCAEYGFERFSACKKNPTILSDKMNRLTNLLRAHSPFNQLVRHKRIRKPIFLGTAKSKLYRIPKRPQIPEEERQELFRLHTNYKTSIRSVRSFLAGEYEKNQQKIDVKTVEKEAAVDFERCKAINDEWNKRVGAAREKRQQTEREANMEQALQRIDAKKERDERLTEKMTALIEEEKEYVKDLIPPDRLNEAIELAIDSVTSYNFALDMKGNIVKDEVKETVSEINVGVLREKNNDKNVQV